MSPIPPFTPGDTVTQAQLTQAVDDLIAGAPGALDTLNELAASINDDAAVYTTLSTALSDHVNDTANAHAATAIDYDNAVSGLAATQVQDAIDEVAGAGGGGQDLSEITIAYLDTLISSVANGTVITAAGRSWSTLAEGTAYTDFDQANMRVRALQDGRFRLTWACYQDADSTSSNVRVQHGVTVSKNGTDPVGHGQATSIVDAASSEVTATFSGSIILDLLANDDIRMAVSVQATGTVDVDVNPASGGTGTFVQLEYLGPTPV